MKNKRQEAILELIERYEIQKQEELIKHLEARGFSATQATVSRDIRELQLTKVLTKHGIYRYIAPKREDMVSGLKFNAALVDSIISVEYAMNMIVIKTYPGLAQAVAAGVDNLSIAEVLGCVAGDDTIMVVTKSEGAAKSISERIHIMMKAS